MGFKRKVKQIASLMPPFRRLFAEVDDLRRQNVLLAGQLAASASELKIAHAKFFKAWQQREHVWVPPGHFYSPIPSVFDLKVNEYDSFPPASEIRGIRLNEEGQLALLTEFGDFYPDQPFTAQAAQGRRYLFENTNYSYMDAIVLYCMMRHVRPKRIIEIGSGYSSGAMLDVNELFFENAIACTFIDPYPQLLKDLLKESDYRQIRILDQRVQDVDIEIFRELSASDILFIDSSHVTKTGSDVNHIIFEI